MNAFERHAHFQIVIAAQAAPQLHHALHHCHLFVQIGITVFAGKVREVTEMHGLGHILGPQIAVNRFGDKGHKGGADLTEGQQHIVQRFIGLLFIGIVFTFPEAPTTAANIPVGQVFNKEHKGPHR